MIAAEVLDIMKRNNGGLIFKLDFEKAYNRVNCQFLFFILHKMGFGDWWIRWIMRCTSVAPVSVLVNGSPGQKFCMQCGLRQRCPLSPLIFNLVAESFTILVNQVQEKGWLIGVPIPGLEKSIYILQYADDTILFLRGSEGTSSKIQNCLTIFSLISGLTINLHKSVVYGMGCDSALATSIASELGCQVGSLPFKYLGLPLGSRSLSCVDWNHVVDMFRAKLSICKAKHLSIGSRLTLIKSVLSSIPIYPLSSGFCLSILGTFFTGSWVSSYGADQRIVRRCI